MVAEVAAPPRRMDRPMTALVVALIVTMTAITLGLLVWFVIDEYSWAMRAVYVILGSGLVTIVALSISGSGLA